MDNDTRSEYLKRFNLDGVPKDRLIDFIFEKLEPLEAIESKCSSIRQEIDSMRKRHSEEIRSRLDELKRIQRTCPHIPSGVVSLCDIPCKICGHTMSNTPPAYDG